MTISETYNYLNCIYKIDKAIKNKSLEREKLCAIATKTTQENDGMPHSHNAGDKVGDIAVKIVTLEKTITSTLDLLLSFEAEASSFFMKLPPDEYDVLHKKYIQKKSIKEISAECKKSRQWVRAKERKAVKDLSEILQATELYERINIIF